MKLLTKLLAVLVIILIINWSFNDMIPAKKISAENLKTTDFSLDNALYHLKNISKKSHFPGTKEHKEVQNYLVNELKKLGLAPKIQAKTVVNNKWKAGTTVENIVAKIKGSENGKALLVLSHYDSNPHSSLGASDAGSGIVTILEGLRAFLAKGVQPKNDVIILFSDAEEIGLLGAQAFVKHHAWAKDIGLVLNFEARGSGGSSFMLMETNGKNKQLLSEFIKSNPEYPAASSLMYSIYKKLPNDTDLTVFREQANINGFNFAFVDDHFDYHTAQDSYERMDRESLLHQADYFTSGINYFADADLSDLNSTEDYVYLNFPFSKLISYPFSWVLPMLIIASILFLVLLLIGIRQQKLTILGTLRGFIPFLAALFIAGIVSFLLWKLLVIIHPQYNDILHGFTYNGHQYIYAFVFLTLWIIFKIYSFFKNEKTTDLFIAPLFFGLLINIFIFFNLKGAGFLIIPIYSALLVLAILFFMTIKENVKPLLFTIISIPTLYIISPLIQLFPIALGLKILFVSSIFVVLLFGFMLPVFHQEKQKIILQPLMGVGALIFFAIATFNSGYSVDKKLPNSLVYIQNTDTETSYWGTYNKNLDSFTKQVFNNEYNEGSIPFAEGKSKYNTRFTYHKRAENIPLKKSTITINKDTLIGNLKHLELTIKPERRIHKYELISNTSFKIEEFSANNALVNNGRPYSYSGTLLLYQMGSLDTDLKLSFIYNINEQPELILNEISYDLLSNTALKIKPRNEDMMPMPFVTNDAIITSRKLKL